MGDEKTLIVAKEHIAKAIGMTKIAEKRGWLNYFKLANIHSKLQALDSWLRKRLRYCIWHHWKRPERKRKNLMRLGVNPKDAYAWIRTRMGDWRVTDAGSSSHAWTRLKCPEFSRDGCIISVWSTPRVPQNHASQIKRVVDKCPHS